MNAFEALGLNDNLVQAVTDLGFTEPTPIQTQAIPVLIAGTKDFVGLAQTGTGKTAAFLIPIINKIIEDSSETAIIIAPTRELAIQIEKESSYDVCPVCVFFPSIFESL